MKNFKLRSNTNRNWPSIMLILLTTFATPASAGAFDDSSGIKLWTTVASAGTVQPTDVPKVSFGSGLATLVSSAPALTMATIRYNVVPVDGLFPPHYDYRLRVRFRDNGAEARVRVALIEYDLNTGVTTTRITFDSNDFAASTQFQTQHTPSDGPPSWHFDFANKAYFIQAYLNRTSANGTPGLGAIQLCPNIQLIQHID